MLQDVPTMLGGRYRVVERLGRGGMADVYRAEDVVLRRTVAIKIFRGGVEREQHLARFRTEVRTLAALTHPHLVALYDAGGDITEPWCAMEYVNGGSLADREGPLPPVDVARIGEQIASGLAYVHGRGIVHRDVKPSNVLLDAGGDAFLSDFGIAKLIDGTRMTQSGLMIGTAAFLSPEQVRGRSAVSASDVYALGLVLLEALTGRREYPGTPVESAVSRLSRPPEVPEEFEADWGELITAMTAEDAADRPDPADVALRLHAVARRLAGLAAETADDLARTPDDLAETTGAETTGAETASAGNAAAGSGGAGSGGAATAGKRRAGVGRDAATVAAPRSPAVPSLPVLSFGTAVPVSPADRPPPADERPRNILGWFSPDRRQRAGAAMVAAGVVVAVALALQLVDGRRADSVQLGNSTGTVTSTTAPPAAVAGQGQGLQVRRAPVTELPLPAEDKPVVTATRTSARTVGRDPRPAVAGTATRVPARATVTSVSPSPSPSPSVSSPSPSVSPSASASVSPSSPTSSGSPSGSATVGTGSPTSGPTSTASGSVPSGPGGSIPGLSGTGTGTGVDTGTGSLLGTTPTSPAG